jgi:hypothetical protein
MGIGQDLADVPFAELVHSLGHAIAESQLELDRSAITTLSFLVNTPVDIITEVTDVITAVPRSATLADGRVIPYTGAQVTSSGSAPVSMSLFQAGLSPTFYQFTEASLEVKMSITVRQSSQTSTSGGPPRLPFRVHASPVDYRTSNTYSYTAQGSSTFRTVMKPVPAPSRLTPARVTVDTLTSPPRVTVTG